ATIDGSEPLQVKLDAAIKLAIERATTNSFTVTPSPQVIETRTLAVTYVGAVEHHGRTHTPCGDDGSAKLPAPVGQAKPASPPADDRSDNRYGERGRGSLRPPSVSKA